MRANGEDVKVVQELLRHASKITIVCLHPGALTGQAKRRAG